MRSGNYKQIKFTDLEAWGKVYDYTSRRFEYRESVRAVVKNEEGLIAIQHLTKHGVYTLPGGGIELGETAEQALHREIKEEVGTTIESYCKLAEILDIRYRPDTEVGKIQLNYAFNCKCSGELAALQLTPGEIKAGCEIKWITVDEAVKNLNSLTKNLEDFARFAQLRDLAILKLIVEGS
jgi:8-oxo-dGTP pyrophosphatase MutT (NUDIX family)